MPQRRERRNSAQEATGTSGTLPSLLCLSSPGIHRLVHFRLPLYASDLELVVFESPHVLQVREQGLDGLSKVMKNKPVFPVVRETHRQVLLGNPVSS